MYSKPREQQKELKDLLVKTFAQTVEYGAMCDECCSSLGGSDPVNCEMSDNPLKPDDYCPQQIECINSILSQIDKIYSEQVCPECSGKGRKLIKVTNAKNTWSDVGVCKSCHGSGSIPVKWVRLNERTKIVCLCGSTRFKDTFFDVAKDLTCKGQIVLAPFHFRKCGDALTPELETLLSELHFKKIDIADEVFVLNVGGYIGDSTRSEIEYATKHGKPIKYLEEII